MKILYLVLALNVVLASAHFGRAYMRKSKLCHHWVCINNKLNFTDGLPTKEEFSRVLHNLLPSGSWQEVADNVVETCYNNRSRRYTNTCPGQALLHCAVDQLNNNCPLEFTNPHDGCAPINSLAGFGHMFTQSRYPYLETYLQQERRPEWFLRNYFNTKCCNLPRLFNSTTLSECGFQNMVAFYTHMPLITRQNLPNEGYPFYYNLNQGRNSTQHNNINTNMTREYRPFYFELLHGKHRYEPTNIHDSTNAYGLKIQDFNTELPNVNFDPLDCCNISDFITPIWRQQCDFKLKWESQNRFVIKESDYQTTTTSTERITVHSDLVVLPNSCEEETCVFKKLGILSETNTVNVALFTKLLDNFTSAHNTWERVKARAITTCLDKPLSYDGECEINKVLTCLFDVLPENHLREMCILPMIVNKTILNECGLISVCRIEEINTTNKYKISSKGCKDITPPTSCILTKMGVLNKYGFMDYFKMKDRLKVQPLWIESFPQNAFNNAPFYKEHCNSPRKLLNVLDSMIMTCPSLKRSQSPQCSKMFEEITSMTSISSVPKAFIDDYLIKGMFEHYHSLDIPNQYRNNFHKNYSKKIIKKPLYNYGILNSESAPKVETIDLRPKVENKPLVILPVYMRVPQTNLVLKPHDNMLRSGLWHQNSIPTPTHSVSTNPTKISTIDPVSTTPVSTIIPISPTPVTYRRIPYSNLLIRSNNVDLLQRPFWKNSNVANNFKYRTNEPFIPISTTPKLDESTTPKLDESTTESLNKE